MEAIHNFWKPYIYERILGVFPHFLIWRERRWVRRKIAESMACADNAKIPRHPDAGKIVGQHQIMHNGLRIKLDCYSTPTNKGMLTEFFVKNRGVHEPSEEFAFQEILKYVKEGGTILELGAWWSFYSMWFLKSIKNSKAFMVEPIASHVDDGRYNFELNGFKGHFFQAFVGGKSGFWKETKRSLFKGTYEEQTDVPVICVDDHMKNNGIDFIDVLHSDIQGAELDMLKGAQKAIRERKIHFFVISTHADRLHQECVDYLKANDYVILCDADVTHSAHIDGFIVARAKEMPGPDKLEIDKLP